MAPITMTKYYLLCAIPSVVDILSCGFDVRRAIKGSGASGVPIVTFILYGPIIWMAPFVSVPIKIYVSFVAILVHVLLLFVIPNFVERLYKRK